MVPGRRVQSSGSFAALRSCSHAVTSSYCFYPDASDLGPVDRDSSCAGGWREAVQAILELSVPAEIMQRLYADPIAAWLAKVVKIVFEPESGLNELLAEWPKTFI